MHDKLARFGAIYFLFFNLFTNEDFVSGQNIASQRGSVARIAGRSRFVPKQVTPYLDV
jgi:hypothetical protein